MKRLTTIFLSVIILSIPAFSIASETKESVDIKKDPVTGGHTATYQDGDVKYHPAGEKRSEIKEYYEQHDVKVNTSRTPGGRGGSQDK